MTIPVPAMTPAEPAPFRWLPIRSLGPRHRSRIAQHLLALGPDDRYLRFGYIATDSHIGRYVDQLDFDHDEVFGVFNRRLDLVAMAHLAYMGPVAERPTSAEFGVSVLPKARGRGMGSRLFERACLHARNRHIDTLIVHALSENVAMLKIARHAGATLGRDGADATAILTLPPDDLGSHWSQLFETHASEIDYSLKLQAARLDRLAQNMRDFLPGPHANGD